MNKYLSTILAASLAIQPLYAEGKKDATMKRIIDTQLQDCKGDVPRILSILKAERQIDVSLEDCMNTWNHNRNDRAYLNCVSEWIKQHPSEDARLTGQYAQTWLQIRREKRDLLFRRDYLQSMDRKSSPISPDEWAAKWAVIDARRRRFRGLPSFSQELRSVEHKLRQYP